jgi:hypothetical protein
MSNCEEEIDAACEDCQQCYNCTMCEQCELVYCPILNDDPDVRSCEIQKDLDDMTRSWNALLEAISETFDDNKIFEGSMRGKMIAKAKEITLRNDGKHTWLLG